MQKPTPEEIAKAKREQEHRLEVCRIQWGEDVDFCLKFPQSRRLIRFILGPQCSNLLGVNSEGRLSGVALVDELMKREPNAMTILFAKKEEDEHGWI